MIEIEEKINNVRKSTTALCSEITNKAVAAFFDALGDSDYPGDAEVAGAVLAAESNIKRELLSTPILRTYAPTTNSERLLSMNRNLLFSPVMTGLIF